MYSIRRQDVHPVKSYGPSVWLVLAALCATPLSARSSVECINYPDFLRWEGFVACQAEDIAVSGTYAYAAAGTSGLRVLDVRVPASPQVVGSVAVPGNTKALAASGRYVYAAAYSAGLQVIDVSNAGAPQVVGGVDTPGQALGVAVAGHYAYIADGSSGLQVIDVADPAHPSIVGHKLT